MKNHLISVIVLSLLLFSCGKSSSNQAAGSNPTETLQTIQVTPQTSDQVAAPNELSLMSSTAEGNPNFATVTINPAPYTVSAYVPFYFNSGKLTQITVLEPSFTAVGCDPKEIKIGNYEGFFDALFFDDGHIQGKPQAIMGYNIEEGIDPNTDYTLSVGFFAPNTCTQVSFTFSVLVK